MSALLDLAPETRHPALEGVAEVHEALDRMHSAVVARSAPIEHGRLVAELERASRRIDALKLRVLAAADRERVASAHGFSGTDAWAARQTTVSRATAAREVALASELASGYDAVAAALDDGLVSSEHAGVIVRAGHDLPDGVSRSQRASVEAALVEKAQRLNPDQLRRIARRALEAVEPDRDAVDAHENDLVRNEEQAARAKCALTLHDNGDGTTTGRFTVPTLAIAILRKVLDAMTAPRRMRDERGVSTGSTTTGPFDWAHRRGVAFAELLEHLPTDHLHAKTAATLIVTLDHTVLRGALKVAGLDTGETISGGEARRLACGAGVLPAVLAGPSQVLDLGRQQRLFTDTQRTALAAIHETCAADGCQRPFAWCELHHHHPWSQGGSTDLRDAVPLCHWHHQRIHDRAFDHTSPRNGSIRFVRRT